MAVALKEKIERKKSREKSRDIQSKMLYTELELHRQSTLSREANEAILGAKHILERSDMKWIHNDPELGRILNENLQLNSGLTFIRNTEYGSSPKLITDGL